MVVVLSLPRTAQTRSTDQVKETPFVMTLPLLLDAYSYIEGGAKVTTGRRRSVSACAKKKKGKDAEASRYENNTAPNN